MRLSDVLATRQTTLLTVTARRDVVADTLANLSPNATQARRDELTTRLATLSARVVELEAIVADVTARLAANVLREIELTEVVTRLQTVVSNREARCARLAANGDGTDIITTGESGPRLDYIHADHLGRPAFVTDTNGAVLWDGGITTPFGVSLATMGALTQNLMFPGQYRDAETGYDDNWHRTYDPTLGRYLQADPIGLAGGLNRYAYVGGNPVGAVDAMGLAETGTAVRAALPAFMNIVKTKPIRGKNPAYMSGVALGIVGGILVWETKNLIQNSCGNEEDKILPIAAGGPNRNCKKASNYQLLSAGITSAHAFKTDFGYVPNSRFDICACSDGSITIAPRGSCGKIGGGFEPKVTGFSWK